MIKIDQGRAETLVDIVIDYLVILLIMWQNKKIEYCFGCWYIFSVNQVLIYSAKLHIINKIVTDV